MSSKKTAPADRCLPPQPHRRTPKAFASRHNADAHPSNFSVSDFSCQLLLPVFYGEFDGRRRKRVLVKIVGE